MEPTKVPIQLRDSADFAIDTVVMKASGYVQATLNGMVPDKR